ncbi:MAG: family 20 glycosylhydrolase [Clostridia bacterium]|nr:family 20 glycosylhydrolase [Clostridia bacterium]
MQKLTLPKRALSLVLVLVMLAVAAIPVVGMVNLAAGEWSMTDSTEIFVVSDTPLNEDMTEQVQLFASELAEKLNEDVLPISCGALSEAGATDIILMLDSTVERKAEGFFVKKDNDAMMVMAPDADGLFYGCRYVIKELAYDGTVSDAEQEPQVAERSLSLDNGRKYYSVEWIKEMIRELSWANMNALVLHFSEEMGLGIESKLYPTLAGRDGTLCTQAEVETDNTYLTQDEVKEIVEYAKKYHVEIIPSFDSPGHMNYVVKWFNDQCADGAYSFTYDGKTYTAAKGSEIGNYFHYNGKTSIVKGSGNANYSRGIDISNEVAVAFTKSLVEEYATLFRELGCTKFDIGGDELLGWGSAIVSTSTASRWQQLDHWKEYAQERTGNSNAVAYDAFLLYMNDMNDLVRSLGYTSVRMWNDDALRSSDTGWTGVVELDTDIDIWFWTTGSNIFYDYANEGYQLYNIISDYNYYAMTPDYYSSNRSSFTQAYADQIYNEWTPYIFYPADLNADWKHNPTVGNPNVLGGSFGIWSDNPTLRTEAQVMADVVPMLRANGAKSWDPYANSEVSYSDFTAYFAKIGDAPAGTVAAGDVYYGADVSALQAAVATYDTVDAALYTEESFDAYAAAVTVGRKVLNLDKPLQEEVDDATAVINEAYAALELKPVADTTALEAAIAEYETVDAALYTAESYEAYTKAIDSAKALLESGVYTQDEVDAAKQNIDAWKTNLREVETVSEVECFISGSFRTSKVYVGKLATMNISTIKGRDIKGFEIYNEAGTIIDVVRQTVNTRKSDRDNWTIIMRPTEAEAGDEPQTYTVYAVLGDGSRSADCLEMSILVIS